jgi:excisionase family DNA binding protein
LHTLISSREAANRLGVSQATVLRAVARGTLRPARTTPGGHHRFSLEEIDSRAGAPSPSLARGTTLISTSAAAKLLAVSQHTVIRACREGRLVADETTPGGHRRFSEERIRTLAPRTKELVGTGGAARAMGLTIDKLLRAVHEGEVIPAAVTPGGHRRFAAADLPLNGARPKVSAGRHANGSGAGHAS